LGESTPVIAFSMMTAMAMTATTTPKAPGASSPVASPGIAATFLWNPATGRFYPVRLRRAMALRLWTADDLAREAGVSRTTVYKALAGAGVLDKIAYKIILAIQGCEPHLSDID